MTPEELDQKLRSISEHEKLYRRGFQNPRSNSFPSVEINGRKVMQFSYSLVSSENNGIPFLVKKHSRFRDYPYHTHDWIELSYMYSGRSCQIIEDQEYELEEGQLLLMAPGIAHTLKPLSENDIMIQIAIGQSNLTNNFFNRLSSTSIISDFLINAFTENNHIDHFYLFHAEKSRRLRVFITEFLCEWYEPSLATYDIQNDLFSLIISELVNVFSVTSTNTSSQRQNQYILPSLHYIEKNYRTCTLEKAAETLGLHPNYLSALLKKATGSTFNEIVQKERLAVSERLLLNSDLSVAEIADMTGYHNMSFFYRIFQKKNGCLPGEYRARYHRKS